MAGPLVMACYYCLKRLGNTKVAVGDKNHVHPACYENYQRFLKQIKVVLKSTTTHEDSDAQGAD